MKLTTFQNLQRLSVERGDFMKKKVFGIILAIVLIFAMLAFVIFGILRCEIFIDESPNGDYQIVSLWIDKGGFGYGGAFYIKEKGLFSKWHKIAKVPGSCEWISETQFTIYRPSTFDANNEKEYNVKEFFDK